MNYAFYILPVLLAVSIPSALAEVGQNYDTVTNEDGSITWTSHPERILVDDSWQNYFLQTTDEKIIFSSNSIGGLTYDISTCSYSLYENGYGGSQIIPSVSILGTQNNNGTWENLAVNEESCNVDVIQNNDGIVITSEKFLDRGINEIVSSNGTITTSSINQKFVHEINIDINKGIKETFYIYDNTNSGNELGISQTIHVGESVVIGNEEIQISDFDGMNFDRDFIIENKAEILQLTDSINYDFDIGIDSLTSVNIIHDESFLEDTYKVNMDYSNGSFIGYLEIDPTFTKTGTVSGGNWNFDLSTLPTSIIINSGDINGIPTTSTQNTAIETNAGSSWSTPVPTYNVYSFGSTGTFEITSGSGAVEYLLIGGGGGGTGNGAGGGGGFLEGAAIFPTGTYSISVGSGGSAASYPVQGGNGGDTTFGSLTAYGGGGGGRMGSGTYDILPGSNGGSGGGGAAEINRIPSSQPGGSGVSGQGHNGGTGSAVSPAGAGGGGGGAGSAGGNGGSSMQGGAGGAGKYSDITGSNVCYAGGGGGGTWQTSGQGSGGCGAGNGLNRNGGGGPTAGTNGLGGGGGGKWDAGTAGVGGSGKAILSYNPNDITATVTGGSFSTVTPSGTPVLSLNYIVATVPNNITDLSASFNFPNIDLSFSTPSDGGTAITSFKVYRDTGSGYSLYDTVTGSSLTSYQDTNPVLGTVNNFKINAVNSVGEASDSNVASVTAGTPPGNPTGLTSTIQDANNAPLDVFLQWSSPVSWGSGTAQGFEVYRNGVLITTTGLVNSYTDTVTQGSHSHYVKAVSSHGTSGNSNTANITTPNVPDAITDLSGSVISDTQINVTWTAPNDGGSNIDLYKIFRDGSQIDTTTNTNYSLTGLTANTAYTITVYSNNSVGDSLVSNSVNLTTYQPVSGSITVTPNTQGATTQLTFSASGITGTPTPTFSTFTLKEGNNVIASGISSPYTLALNDNNSHTYTVTSTDNTHWNTPTISGSTTVTATYDPNWSNGISYNYTRASGVIDLTVNRDTQSLWDATCNYKTTAQVMADQTGIVSNFTNVWYINDSQNIADTETVYVSCNEDGTTLFSFTSFGPNRLGGGITQLDAVFGEWTGTPVALIFVLLVAGLFTGRSAPTGILLILALIGVLGFIGMLTIDEAVWGFLLLAGVLGIFLGKRFL